MTLNKKGAIVISGTVTWDFDFEILVGWKKYFIYDEGVHISFNSRFIKVEKSRTFNDTSQWAYLDKNISKYC